jgi:hypothetical protein
MKEVDKEVDKEVEAAKGPQAVSSTDKSDIEMKLVSGMLAAKIVDIKPQLDFTTELGFIYPVIEQTVKVKGEEAVSIVESLTGKGILKKSFFDRLLRCPRCKSIHLRPSTHCPKCNSGNVARGRILQHLACSYTGIEDEFTAAGKGRYVCPRCNVELRTMGADYESRGVLRKCRDCGEIFSVPLLKWRCLKCSSLADEDEVDEVNVYAYSLDETKKNWLDFELQSKAQFIELLRQRGYKVTENAVVKGRSGAEHCIDILATRDDGVVIHKIAVGVEIARDKVGLDKILDFDVKAYDSGMHDKILITIPGLGEEAEKFASFQRMKVLGPSDLETVLSGSLQLGRKIEMEPFEFKSKAQLMQYLEKQGYKVKENAEVTGRSGAIHKIDMLAIMDEGLITHRIAVGIVVGEKPMVLDKVFDFDVRAYDAGILDKVFIAVPGLTREAKLFARRQGISVFEVEQLESPGKGNPKS